MVTDVRPGPSPLHVSGFADQDEYGRLQVSSPPTSFYFPLTREGKGFSGSSFWSCNDYAAAPDVAPRLTQGGFEPVGAPDTPIRLVWRGRQESRMPSDTLHNRTIT